MNSRILAGLALLAASTPSFANGITKFDRREPDASYVSTANINDIERCLVRLDGISGTPTVFSQPDRPNQRMLMWYNDNSDGSSRVDLEIVPGGTRIVVWRIGDPRKAESCAPRSQ